MTDPTLYIPLSSGPDDRSTLYLKSKPRRLFKSWLFKLLVIIIVVSVTLNLVFIYRWWTHQCSANVLSSQVIYSPAQDALEYTAVKFNPGFGTDLPIYDRPPSDEVDSAWESLYTSAAVRIPKSQAALLPNKTWPILGDKQNYIIALEVFHQLHCLNDIRQAIYSDYYHRNYTSSTIPHCLSEIRQSLMCSVDISTIVWQWSQRSKQALERADIVHSCRNFEKIQEWVQEHHFDASELDLSVYIEDDIEIKTY